MHSYITILSHPSLNIQSMKTHMEVPRMGVPKKKSSSCSIGNIPQINSPANWISLNFLWFSYGFHGSAIFRWKATSESRAPSRYLMKAAERGEEVEPDQADEVAASVRFMEYPHKVVPQFVS